MGTEVSINRLLWEQQDKGGAEECLLSWLENSPTQKIPISEQPVCFRTIFIVGRSAWQVGRWATNNRLNVQIYNSGTDDYIIYGPGNNTECVRYNNVRPPQTPATRKNSMGTGIFIERVKTPGNRQPGQLVSLSFVRPPVCVNLGRHYYNIWLTTVVLSPS